MNQFIDTINELEAQKRMLQNRFEAQKKLEKIIPINLENNLSSLKKYFPSIYEKFKNYKLKNNYKLTCNENKEPNVILSDGSYFYGKSPFNDCKNQVDDFLNSPLLPSNISKINCQEKNPFGQLHFYYKNKLYNQVSELLTSNTKNKVQINKTNGSIPLLVMLGIGLGYHLAYLYEKFTPINIYIIEPDQDLFFLSLCVFDYATLFDYINNKHLGIKFIFLDNPELIVSDLDNYCSKYGMNIAVKNFYCHYQSSKITEIKNNLVRDVSSITIKNGFFDDILIGISHSITNIIKNIPILTDSTLPEHLRNIPVFIIGNGPSLDQDLELIKKINDRICIIACGTAITSLINYGIKVDIYVALERTETVQESLKPIKNKINNILCIAPDIIHPNVLNMFKYKALGLKANEVIPHLLMLYTHNNNLEHYCCLNFCNPLVSNMGIFSALYLGFKSLYLVGIDNGSASSRSHSIHSLYYDKNGMIKKEVQDMELNKLPLTYPGNFKREIKTNSLFKISIRIMEELIEKYKNNHYFYNASDGAKIQWTKPLHLYDVLWEQYPIFDHDNLRNTILASKTKVIDASGLNLSSMLKCERYNEITNQLISDLKDLPNDKVETVLKLEAHLDYLTNLRKEGLIIGSSSLYGSLSLMYAGYLTALYYTDIKNQSKKLRSVIQTIIDFIKETQKFYPYSFEYGYDFIRKNIKFPKE